MTLDFHDQHSKFSSVYKQVDSNSASFPTKVPTKKKNPKPCWGTVNVK